ncbi:MAG: outer membrane protein assembly factor BamB [Burkholderiales bacterium]|jgi:outer membrane protein assembly factor BamB
MLNWRVVVAALLCGVLTACGGTTTLKPSPLPDFERKIDTRIGWQATVGEARDYLFVPVSFHDMVCAIGSSDRLSCFSSANGERMWDQRLAVKLSGGVGVGENMLLVGTANGEVIAFDASGTLLWRSQVTTEVLSAPVGSRSMVIVRAGDSNVFGLSAKDGASRWQYEGPRQPLVLRSNPGMAILDDVAAIGGFPGGRLIKLDVRDGGLLWDIPLATPRGDNELERLTDVAGTPLLVSGSVCAVAYQGRIGCFDTEKGEQVWARSASSAGGITADDKSVYYTEADSVVVALDKSAGASVWRQEKLLYRRVSAPAVVGDWIVVGDYQGYVHVLAREDGAFVARVATDGSAIVGTPVPVGDGVAVQTRNGGLYMIDLKSRS